MLLLLFSCGGETGTEPPEPETPEYSRITFNFHTGTDQTPNPIVTAYEDILSLELPAPEREGYTFEGWYTDEKHSEEFTTDDILPETETVELYAKFSPIAYKIKFISAIKIDDMSLNYGTKIFLKTPSHNSLFFGGFFEDAEFTTPFTTEKMPAHDVEVYVRWASHYTVTVTSTIDHALTLEGGETVQKISKTSGFTPIEVTANFGYKYKGYEINGTLYEDTTVNVTGITADTEIKLLAEYATYELPIVTVDTDGVPIKNKVDYVDMTFKLLNTDEEITDATGGIRYRGNSTYTFVKKPYRIKFDSKESLFGLDKAKSWVLLADYLDPSGLHNYTAFTLAEDAGFRFVPTPHKVNLYLNGEYMGMFTMCEQVQENPGRIDIEEDITEDMVSLKDFNFFIAMDGKVLEDPEAVEGETYFYLEEYGKYIELKYPEKDQFVSDEQFESFFSQLKEYMSYLFGIFTARDAEAIKAEINVTSLVNYAIIDQIMGENDHSSHSFNMFFTNTSGDTAVDGKLNFGPIWDYDYCLHTKWSRIPNQQYDISDKESYSNVFLAAVKNIPEFSTLRNERWRDYFAPKLTEFLAEYDELTASISESLALNYERWYTELPEDITEKNLAFLHDFLAYRLELFNERWKIEEVNV